MSLRASRIIFFKLLSVLPVACDGSSFHRIIAFHLSHFFLWHSMGCCLHALHACNACTHCSMSPLGLSLHTECVSVFSLSRLRNIWLEIYPASCRCAAHLEAPLQMHRYTLNPVCVQALEAAVANLNYGSVHINTDAKLSIAFASMVWGGCPGSTIYDLHSGMGFVSGRLFVASRCF